MKVLRVIVLFFVSISLSYAFGFDETLPPLTKAQMLMAMKQSGLDDSFPTQLTPEVVQKINDIRHSYQAKTYMQAAIKRLRNYQSTISRLLTEANMPSDFVVLPIVQSGCQVLDPRKNRMAAAGIWQMTPSTAKKFGLTIDGWRDQRFDTEAATRGVFRYLLQLDKKFHSWDLVLMAYEVGEKRTQGLIEDIGSRDVWTLARSPIANQESVTADLDNYLAMFSATVIIVHNPELIGM